MAFILGISITLNVISILGFLIIYKYSLKGLKRKIENYVLDNFMELDTSMIEKIDLRGVKNDY